MFCILHTPFRLPKAQKRHLRRVCPPLRFLEQHPPLISAVCMRAQLAGDITTVVWGYKSTALLLREHGAADGVRIWGVWWHGVN